MNPYSSTTVGNQTIQQALKLFFEKYQLGPDGGMNDNWAHLHVGKLRIPFPNTASRKKALLFHDVHHIATGYESNWKGECETGAWEISTGCGNYIAAWVLDFGALALGGVMYPVATFKAFVRGQRTLNFYKSGYTRQQLMNMKIAEAQTILKLDADNNAPANVSEIAAFIQWWLIAEVFSLTVFTGPIILVIYWLIHLHR